MIKINGDNNIVIKSNKVINKCIHEYRFMSTFNGSDWFYCIKCLTQVKASINMDSDDKECITLKEFGIKKED